LGQVLMEKNTAPWRNIFSSLFERDSENQTHVVRGSDFLLRGFGGA